MLIIVSKLKGLFDERVRESINKINEGERRERR